jgi:cyclase
MLEKRIVVCLDVRDGKTTKGVKFQGNVDIGDPVEMARGYYEAGCDELVFYDITASSEGRGIFIDVVERVAREIFIPFCVGGGLGSIEDIRRVINAGAEKVSLNSQAVKNPAIISEGAAIFGRQCVVLGMDALKDPAMPSGYQVVINGGRVHTGRDALAWALEAEKLGAGEIVLNSIDTDGVRNGYEIELTKMISEAVGIPVVASGGAGEPEHLAQVLSEGRADAALIASMVHYGDYSISDIKRHLDSRGIPVRRT